MRFKRLLSSGAGKKWHPSAIEAEVREKFYNLCPFPSTNLVALHRDMAITKQKVKGHASPVMWWSQCILHIWLPWRPVPPWSLSLPHADLAAPMLRALMGARCLLVTSGCEVWFFHEAHKNQVTKIKKNQQKLPSHCFHFSCMYLQPSEEDSKVWVVCTHPSSNPKQCRVRKRKGKKSRPKTWKLLSALPH